MCSYKVVAKDVSFESTIDKLSAEVSKTLDNVFIIFDEEVTGDNQKHLNIYVYDGNFIRDSFEEELLEFSDMIFAKSLFPSLSASYPSLFSRSLLPCSIYSCEEGDFT